MSSCSTLQSSGNSARYVVPPLRLFDKAKRGLRILGTTKEAVLVLMAQLLENPSGVQRI